MTDSTPASAPAWTCPFCSLLCDDFRPTADEPPRLQGSDCPRALAGLAAHARADASDAQACIDGAPATLDAALAAAASRLAGWRQPLFGGLGTDVAGARALYRLAARTGAICDHAEGDALMHGVRAQQDRGVYYTTIGEVRSRADLIVCVGTQGCARYPELFRRFGLHDDASPCQEIVFLGAPPAPGLPGRVACTPIAGSGDLFADLQQLAALVAQQRLALPDAALAALAQRLRAARYAVLVWEAGALPAHGALLVEALNRIVGTLNRHTRAATFSLGGSNGAYSVNYAFTWLSGLPLRTRVGRDGLAHEPVRFAGQRLVASRAVDGILWVMSFDPQRLPPPTDLPRIVLGPPAMQPRLREAGALDDCVFLPVATPGLNAAGHLFRTDGSIVLPLVAVRDDGLPGVARIAAQLAEALGDDPAAQASPAALAGHLSSAPEAAR